MVVVVFLFPEPDVDVEVDEVVDFDVLVPVVVLIYPLPAASMTYILGLINAIPGLDAGILILILK